jgi:large subunit ribosomal protein L4
MTIDVVNAQNEKVDSLEMSDEIFGGRVRSELVWEAVVHEQASRRRGTHATKTRGRVSGSGKKPWRQKGTGRARVGEVRNPLWRTGGTVFGPQPRSYGYRLPKKVARAGLGAAFRQRLAEGNVIVVDAFAIDADGPQTRQAAAFLERLGVNATAVLVDVRPDGRLARATRNLRGVRVVASQRLTARDVVSTRQLIVSRAAVDHLARVLGS